MHGYVHAHIIIIIHRQYHDMHVGINDNCMIYDCSKTDLDKLSLRSCHLLHGSFILHGGHQFLAYSIVNLHELCHASVKTDGLSFGQLSLVVLWRYALLVT